MSDKKTRFVVESNGKEYELFSIRENSAGELYVIFKPLVLSNPVGQYEVSRRMSVHGSPDSQDGSFLVKTTTEYNDGKKESAYASILPSKSAHCMVVCSHVVQAFTDADLCTAKASDPRIRVCAGLTVGTLFYSLAVSRYGLSEGDFHELGLSVLRIPFSNIELFVLSGLFRTGATMGSKHLYKMSQPSIYDGEPDIWIKSPGAPDRPRSPEPHQISYLVGDDIELMSRWLKADLEKITFPDGTPLTQADIEYKKRGYEIYWNGPDCETMTDFRVARMVQKANPPKGIWLPQPGSVTKIGRRERD